MQGSSASRGAAALATTLIAVAAAGCGSTSSNSATANPQIPQVTTPSAVATNSIATGLNEMSIVTAPSFAKSGKVTFALDNTGKITHEMVVIRTDKAAGALGTGSHVSEAGSVGETGDVAAGVKKTLSLNLKAGHYALICNLPGHYAAGMFTDFNVR